MGSFGPWRRGRGARLLVHRFQLLSSVPSHHREELQAHGPGDPGNAPERCSLQKLMLIQSSANRQQPQAAQVGFPRELGGPGPRRQDALLQT